MFENRRIPAIISSLALFAAAVVPQTVDAAQQPDRGIAGHAAVLEPATAAKLEAGLAGLKPGPAVVVFLDLECKACAKAYPQIRKALHASPQLQYIPEQFPLAYHKHAFDAAVAAEIARDHGQYAETVADLLSGKYALDVPSLNKYLQSHSMPPIVGSAKSKPYEDRVQAEKRFALSIKVDKTPTLVVRDANGAWHTVGTAGEISVFAP